MCGGSSTITNLQHNYTNSYLDCYAGDADNDPARGRSSLHHTHKITIERATAVCVAVRDEKPVSRVDFRSRYIASRTNAVAAIVFGRNGDEPEENEEDVEAELTPAVPW